MCKSMGFSGKAIQQTTSRQELEQKVSLKETLHHASCASCSFSHSLPFPKHLGPDGCTSIPILQAPGLSPWI